MPRWRLESRQCVGRHFLIHAQPCLRLERWRPGDSSRKSLLRFLRFLHRSHRGRILRWRACYLRAREWPDDRRQHCGNSFRNLLGTLRIGHALLKIHSNQCRLAARLKSGCYPDMKTFSALMLIGIFTSGLATSGPATPDPLEVPEVPVPADDCFGRSYTCQAKLSFTVVEDGSVGDIKVLESSRSYPCDRALIHSLRGRVYPEQLTATELEERLVGYQCINGRPTTNWFKAMPLRGTP